MTDTKIDVPETSAREQFTPLAAQWVRETGHLSSRKKMFEHPAYKKILALGPSAVKEILFWLSMGGRGHWDHALFTLTGERPDLSAGAKDLSEVRQAWISWGRHQNLLPQFTQEESAAIYREENPWVNGR